MVSRCECNIRINEIIQAFQEYIDESYVFDIVYSSKYGYLWLGAAPIEFRCFQLLSPEILLERLFWQIYSDVTNEITDTELACQEIRNRINFYLSRLPNKKEYEEAIKAFLQSSDQTKGIPSRKRLAFR